MKLLSETFQRQLVIKDFSLWFRYNIRAFIQPIIHNQNILEPLKEEPIQEALQEEVLQQHAVLESEKEDTVFDESIQIDESNVNKKKWKKGKKDEKIILKKEKDETNAVC
jgi:hypothetical protein